MKTFENLKNQGDKNHSQDVPSSKSLLKALNNFRSHYVRSRPNTKEMSRVNLNQNQNKSENYTD